MMKLLTTLTTSTRKSFSNPRCNTFSLMGMILRRSLAFVVILSVVPIASVIAATDSDFLACARFDDRGQRIACLEDALEKALSAQRDNAAPAPAAAVSPGGGTPSVANDTPAAGAAAAASETPSLLDRVRAFGKRAEVSTDESGNEHLHDTIASLEKRNELWILTLSSGQVWRQSVARNMNLRAGDEIEIFQEGIGNGFRLTTPRLSGFIRVDRVR